MEDAPWVEGEGWGDFGAVKSSWESISRVETRPEWLSGQYIPRLELGVPGALGRVAVHLLSISPVGLLPTANSNQVDLRHPKLTTYRCFLPDLTGFVAFRCAGPGYQRYLSRAVPAVPRPRAGIQPRYSGLRVQGTASSPSSTAKSACYINGELLSRWFSTRGQPLEELSPLL